MDYELLRNKARSIRRRTFEMVIGAGKGHLGGSLSCVEILVALYHGKILRFDPKDPCWEERDIFIMSKGHSNNSLYVVLADVGFYDPAMLKSFSKDGSIFSQHCDMQVPGVELITGSLGHGLGVAAGIGLGYKLDKRENMIFVMMGDGECQEGSVWEAATFAAHHRLDALVALVDRNGLGSEDFTEKTAPLEPFQDKWKAFGWDVRTVDGHSVEELVTVLEGCRTRRDGRPLVIIANTIKGKGIRSLENQPRAHHTVPKGEEIEKARQELS